MDTAPTDLVLVLKDGVQWKLVGSCLRVQSFLGAPTLPRSGGPENGQLLSPILPACAERKFSIRLSREEIQHPAVKSAGCRYRDAAGASSAACAESSTVGKAAHVHALGARLPEGKPWGKQPRAWAMFLDVRGPPGSAWRVCGP